MIDRQTFLVYGQVTDKAKAYAGLSFAVVAYSNRYIDHELVDATDVAHSGTHYGLNLPAGSYDLLVLVDQDRNGSLNQSEVVGRHQIELTDEAYPEKVAHNIDFELSALEAVDWCIDIPVPRIMQSQESLFYPKGAMCMAWGVVRGNSHRLSIDWTNNAISRGFFTIHRVVI